MSGVLVLPPPCCRRTAWRVRVSLSELSKPGVKLAQKAQIGSEQALLARQEALFRVSRAINVYRDPKELFRVLANELRRVVDFDFVALFLYDETANKVENPVLETLGGHPSQSLLVFPPKKPSPGGCTTIRNRCS